MATQNLCKIWQADKKKLELLPSKKSRYRLTLASPLPGAAWGMRERSRDHVPTQADDSQLSQPCWLQLQR